MTFDPRDDMIDLRDVISAAEGEIIDGEDEYTARTFVYAMVQDLGLRSVQGDDTDMIDAVRDYSDNETTVIADVYFTSYARDFAEDIGAYDPHAAHGWPMSCINWDDAARELQADFSSFTYDGRMYWIRSV